MTYMIIPAFVFVEDDCCTETPSWVDTSSCNWDSCQVHQEHSEANWQRCQNLTINFNNHQILSLQFIIETLNCRRNQRARGNLPEHGSLWHYVWHQWRRRQCRQEQKCQQFQHRARRLWCNLGSHYWHHRPTKYTVYALQILSLHQHHIWLQDTASPCSTKPLSRTVSLPKTAQMSPPDLCDLLHTTTTIISSY